MSLLAARRTTPDARPAQRGALPLLVLGHGTSLTGNAALPVGLTFAVLEIQRSGSAVAAVLAAETVPMVLLVLVGGVWADRVRRRRLLVSADLVRAALALLAAAAVLSGTATVPVLMVLMAGYGAATAVFQPAFSAFVPEVVGTGPALQRANGVLMMTAGVSWVVGPAAAGLIALTWSPGAVLLLDAATFAVSAVCLGALRGSGAAPSVRHAPFRTELREGWSEFTARRWVWTTIVSVGVVFCFVIAPLNTLGPLVAADRFDGVTSWAFVLAALSAGRVVGGALSMVLDPRRPLLVAVCAVLLQAPAMLALAWTSSLPLLVATQVVGGVGIGYFITVWGTTLQRHVPSHLRARVTSYDWFGSLLSMPLGYALAGVASDLVGPQPVLVLAGVVCVLAVLPLVASREVRGLTREPQEVEAA